LTELNHEDASLTTWVQQGKLLPVRISYEARAGSPPSEIAPGLFMWLPGTAAFEPVALDGAPYRVELRLDMTPDGIRPVSVTVTAPEGSPPVTGTTLRAVQVQNLTRTGIIQGALRGRSETTVKDGTSIELLSPSRTEQDIELIRLRGPVRESLEVAAYLYNLAGLIGLHPAKEVERELGLPRTTATKWIRRARDMGLIGPTEGSTDGEH